MKYEQPKFVQCGEVSAADIRAQALAYPHLRVGGKGIFFDPTNPNEPLVLLGMLPEGYPVRFNFPGGGVDDGEDLAPAIQRECFEEFGEFNLTLSQVQQSVVVAEGALPFPRDGYRGKFEYLVAIPFVGLETLVPKADSKIVLFPPMPWEVAARQVWQDTRVSLDQRVLYERGLRAVPLAAKLVA